MRASTRRRLRILKNITNQISARHARIGLALTYTEKGDLAAAESTLAAAAQAPGASKEILYNLAEVATARGKTDEVYRSIALSARNAVLLSSPLALPRGLTSEMLDLTISFNTRDSLR